MSVATSRFVAPSGRRMTRRTVAIVDLNAGRPNRAMPLLASLVEDAGATPVIHELRRDGLLPRGRHDAYILSGGPGSPLERAPWTRRLVPAVRAWSVDKPVLGICLGFQVMAVAHGWPVRLVSQPRFGPYEVVRTRAGMQDPLLGALARDAMAFEQRRWGVFRPTHPVSRATVLAMAPEGDVISARFGVRAAGTTFHPEASPEAVDAWFRSDPAASSKLEARQGRPALEQVGDRVPRLRSTWDSIIPGFLARWART